MAPKASRALQGSLRVSQGPLRASRAQSAGPSRDLVPVLDGTPKHVVQVCGRAFAIPQSRKVEEVLQLLQAEMRMPDQIFELLDCEGRRLVLDSELNEACDAGRLPLRASLQDSAIHFIENRREELGQMQWKLILDQHDQALARLNGCMHQIRQLEATTEHSRSSVEKALGVMQQELQRATETTQEHAKAECRQIGERVSGVSQQLNAEKNMRDVALQQVDKALQGIRDAMDADRLQTREALRLPLAHLSELRRLVDRERSMRETAEDKHLFEMQSLRERMDEMAAQMKELMHEHGKRFEKASLDSATALEGHRAQAARAHAEMDTFMNETSSTVATLEARCQTLEQRMQDAQERQSESLQRMHQRNDSLSLVVEQSKLDSRDSKDSVAEVSAKVEELLERLQRAEEAAGPAQERQRQRHEAELRNLRDNMISEYGKLLQTQENRLSSRIDHEVSQRQQSLSQMHDNVVAMMKKGGHDVVSLEGSASPEGGGLARLSSTGALQGSARVPSGVGLARSSSARLSVPSPPVATPSHALPPPGACGGSPPGGADAPLGATPRSRSSLTLPSASPMAAAPSARSTVHCGSNVVIAEHPVAVGVLRDAPVVPLVLRASGQAVGPFAN